MLLDGNSLAYRAFFALPTDMATASGQVTNAVFGFTSMLINLLKEHQPDRLAVAFDRPQPTFRHSWSPTTRRGRAETPDILRQQMGLVRQVVQTMHIPLLEAPGFEADDIVATLATEARDRGDDVIIVTGDRDAYQLVEDPHIQRPLQPARRERLRPLRRGRHQGTHRRHPRPLPAVRRPCAATRATTCRASPG